MARPRNGISPCTVVIKLGTSSIVHEQTHEPLLSTLSSVVEIVVYLRRQGHKVILVSSGAIGVGLLRMNIASKPRNLSGKQALAAIGQGRLIALWDNLFGQFEQPIAQILVTRGDISDRTRYLNAVNTFRELLSMGVVPIVNENDTVSVSEIKFGDNDTLSAITSSMMHADYLFLLTDVDGLYTANPRKDPQAKPIEVVSSITAIREQVSTSTLGSNLGTGGMETKLIAAEIATAAGVTTVICSSKHPENVLKIIEYNHALKSTPGTPRELIPDDLSPLPESEQSSGSSTPVLIRPPHTLFKPSLTPMRDLKSWTKSTLFPAGSVIIDAGAHRVLSRRQSGGRLLPVGILGVIGAFASGQAVRIVVRNHPNESVPEDNGTESVSPAIRQTTTAPTVPRHRSTASVSSLVGSLVSLTPSNGSEEPPHTQIAPENQTENESEVNVIEVGRGLANYNSEQIERVKGLNSAAIFQLLGYADSEYVIENVTISIPPT